MSFIRQSGSSHVFDVFIPGVPLCIAIVVVYMHTSSLYFEVDMVDIRYNIDERRIKTKFSQRAMQLLTEQKEL